MNEEKKEIPTIEGTSVDERLVNLVGWRNDNLKEGDCLTLQEIGTAVGLTRERVRQIEAQALKKLRHPANATKLKD